MRSLMFVCLFMVSEGHEQSDTHFSSPRLTYNYNCGTYSKMLLSHIKTLLSEVKEIKRLKQAVTSPTKAPINCTEVLAMCGVNQAIPVKPTPKRLPLSDKECAKNVHKSCAEALKSGCKQSGVYTIDPDDKGSFKAYCDQKTNGGGWTVFQKRQDGSVNFYRGWNDYKKGFGNLKGEHWLGLDKIYRLTHQTRNRLRVELGDWKGRSAYAEYDYFAVANERNKYKLSLGKYKGTAGDSLSGHKGYPFSTKDRGNTRCAKGSKGAWWYESCFYSNLNGPYQNSGKPGTGVNWVAWKNNYYSYKRAEMKIKPT